MPNTPEALVIRNQLSKSGTSIGANYREANRSRSKKDFKNKIKICIGEASEPNYWLDILQELNFNLVSSRTIETIQLLSHNPDNIDNSGDSAVINFHINESQADKDYKILYSLSTNELGLFGFSTFQPDSLVPDQYSKGYFMFVAEPDGIPFISWRWDEILFTYKQWCSNPCP